MVYVLADLSELPHLKGPAVTVGLATQPLLNAAGVAVSEAGMSGWNSDCQSVNVGLNLTITSWSLAPFVTEVIWL